jgi:DNA invertase Pin-like site-specific DNA recombinase
MIVGMTQFVAYYRVSTDRQGESRLGLDAQRQAVAQFVGGAPLLAELQEIESGKNHRNRPKLAEALDLCRRHRATLVIAKLDRLARDVHFISGLMKGGVEFVAVDMPQANRLTVHILAAVAEHEREMIAARTKAALQQVKRELAEKGHRVSTRGRVYTRLGNPPGYDTSRATAQRSAQKPPAYIIEIMRQQRDQGRSYRAIADHLNDEMGSRTPRGHRWHNETIRDILNRATPQQEQHQ